MRVQLIGSSLGNGEPRQFLMSYIVDDVIALDAGCVGFVAPVDVQRRIKHVFLSHSHLDHTVSLPVFLDNVYTPGPECPTVYGNDSVLECLQTNLFNDRVWPDFVRLSTAETPFLKLQRIEANQPWETDGYRITPVPLDHVVPTLGFVVEAGGISVAFISDTWPTAEIWNRLNATPNLKAVFLEASFPNSMLWLAERAKHLTPELFREVVGQFTGDIRIIAVHIKAAYHEQVVAELKALNIDRLEIAEANKVYEF